MPETGIELRELHPDVLSFVVTGSGSIDNAIEAIRAGAYDFITKPVKIDALAIAISRALEHISLKRDVLRLRQTIGAGAPVGRIAGSSAAIRDTNELVERVLGIDRRSLYRRLAVTVEAEVVTARATEPESTEP